jgi:hypothetical protein
MDLRAHEPGTWPAKASEPGERRERSGRCSGETTMQSVAGYAASIWHSTRASYPDRATFTIICDRPSLSTSPHPRWGQRTGSEDSEPDDGRNFRYADHLGRLKGMDSPSGSSTPSSAHQISPLSANETAAAAPTTKWSSTLTSIRASACFNGKEFVMRSSGVKAGDKNSLWGAAVARGCDCAPAAWLPQNMGTAPCPQTRLGQ